MNNTVFGTGSNLAMRNISNLDTLKKMVQKWKDEGSKIVLVSGSWDLIHEGHALYLEVAKSYGDILVVGVDSDKKVKRRKGPRRPIVPQQERLRMLSHLRSVDVVTLKEDTAPKWSLIKAIKPDVLVATKSTYSKKEIDELEKKYCKKVLVHERMATTSTSARLRLVQIDLANKLSQKLSEKIPSMIDEVIAQAVKPEKGK
ncbi:hypothetical protein A3F37_02310 [Candidatus Saccharibacteria bacterium RIFCSPHIGHO2_12_FULL_41_12]|nr:MAG: hypothetical protein A3F37_02310 [Candidatus Saccharibacteria bacterium RIFCSPHIGHO2_12_FULL_41_12]